MTADGDGSYPVEAIPELVDRLVDEKLDFISACRFPLRTAGSMNTSNQVGNKILTIATAVLYGTAVRDSQSGMWVFRRSIYPLLKVTSDGMAFSEEIKLEALLQRLRFGEEHVPYGARVGEVKLQKWRDGWRNLTFLVRKRFGLV